MSVINLIALRVLLPLKVRLDRVEGVREDKREAKKSAASNEDA